MYSVTASMSAFAAWMASAGVLTGKAKRKALPGAWDVTVTADSSLSPVHGDPVILATVSNPGPKPVLVGFRVHQRILPVLPGAEAKVRVPRRTTRRRYRADRQQTVAVVPAGGSTQLSFRVSGAAGTPFSVVAAVGHCDRRLRVITVPVTVPCPDTADESGTAFIVPLF